MPNAATSNFKSVSLSIIKQTLYWPLWWYTGGFFIILKSTGLRIIRVWKGLALDIWLKNIFVPMYGQRDATSRIISFLMRLIQIIFRIIIMLIMTAFILLIPVIYLAMPIVAVWRIIKF